MGITGKMWAYEHFGVIPDMMCFGKKSQVCGFCSTERIDEVKDNVFHNSGRINSTWGGNIVDMVRSRYIIEAIQEYGLLNNAQEVGKQLLWNLRSLPVLDNVRGRGLMIAFDFSEEYVRDLVMSNLSKDMLALKCGSKSIRLRPPLTFSEQDADDAAQFISRAVTEL